ncbi:exonuclease domain-containing protein [Corynebacterium alimapuense]|uniref:exonuclease domain-containing protein n=1 Tax=Corynebacterium alimapuense TaxID=1576874 RepID=UPI001FE3434B|nr:exonuclease domain-containing protein [Corynebacterium alimapuense]
MIPAHGAQLSVTSTSIRIERSALSTALLNPTNADESVIELDLAAVTDVSVHQPSSVDMGWVELAGLDTAIAFSPNQDARAQEFLADVRAALEGDIPLRSTGAVPGLNFVGLDVETANPDSGSICQIGLVRIIDGLEVAECSWLCIPPPGIDHFAAGNINIHGITPEDVADSPRFSELFLQLKEFIGDLPVVAHNAQFDTVALQRACRASGLEVPRLAYGCSLSLSRNAKLGLASHRLPVVAKALGVSLNNHHDAAEDARAAALIVVELAKRAGYEGDLEGFHHACGFSLGSLEPTRAYPVLRERTAHPASPRATDEPPLTTVKSARASTSKAPWQAVATPDIIPEANLDADPNNPLFAQNVTLSGDFEPFDKGLLWSAIAQLGGTIGKNVTKKTTVLVSGPWAKKTSKLKRAEELVDKGQALEIWDATQLFAVLGLDPNQQPVEDEPPF